MKNKDIVNDFALRAVADSRFLDQFLELQAEMKPGRARRAHKEAKQNEHSKHRRKKG